MKIPKEMNRITPGCLAIFKAGNAAPEEDGMIVQVIESIAAEHSMYHETHWKINKPVTWSNRKKWCYEKRHVAPESHLIPISGDQMYTDEDKQRERDLGWLKEDLIPTGNIKDGKIKIYGVKS